MQSKEDIESKKLIQNMESILTNNPEFFWFIKSKIGKVNLLWSFPNDDDSIQKNINLFLNQDETLSFIKTLRNKYYSKNSISSYIFIGSRLFISDMITKLPIYESIFKNASQKYNIDWKLLAAISYQESKWNNDAVSPTGVRGLMMLTKSTIGI